MRGVNSISYEVNKAFHMAYTKPLGGPKIALEHPLGRSKRGESEWGRPFTNALRVSHLGFICKALKVKGLRLGFSPRLASKGGRILIRAPAQRGPYGVTQWRRKSLNVKGLG